MHSGRNYSLKEVMIWTRRETVVFFLLAVLPTLAYQLAGWHWLTLPWLPIALIGTGVAFITGLKKTALPTAGCGKPAKFGARFST